MPSHDWSKWRPLDGIPPLEPAVLGEILDGGQAFRWHRVQITGDSAASAIEGFGPAAPPPRGHSPAPDAPSAWLGQWSDCVAQLRLGPNAACEWRAPTAIAPRVAAALPAYFAMHLNFTALADSLPWRSDPHLARCLDAFRGLRILRQPFGETLLGFLCSATKQIVQIKQMLASLAKRHGAPLTGDITPARARTGGPSVPTFHRLPTWTELARISESDLRACQLGFRARYIAETARFLSQHPGWLEQTESLDYVAAKERLCSLPGVGEKVADCVLLFGAGKLEAFPVDVWILKTMARRYGLEDWRPAQLAQFGRVHFGALAGFAQQYLFAWERRTAKTLSLDK